MMMMIDNPALIKWAIGKCDRIKKARGAGRYQAFASAVYSLNCGQGDAPVSGTFNKRGHFTGVDKGEVLAVLHWLCAVALGAGVKTETVQRAYQREIKHIL